MRRNVTQTVTFKAVNKKATKVDYKTTEEINTDCYLTSIVSIEKYRGKINGVGNSDKVFLRDTNLIPKKGNLSLMWNSTRENFFFGDLIINGRKTLLIFELSANREKVKIHAYRTGYYPKTKTISQIIHGL